MFLKTKQGNVHLIEHHPIKPIKKAVLCIHGFCCDARIFDYLAKNLAESGVDVYCIDLLGHGKSDGNKGDPDFAECLEAIKETIKTIQKDSQIYILGHSIGCTFAMWYAREFPNTIDGIILMSPYIRISKIKRSDVEPSMPLFLYMLFKKLFTPKSRVDITKILPNYQKIGGVEISQMLRDPNLNFQYSYRYLVDVVAMRNSKVKHLSQIKTPVFILHGKMDRNVYPQVSEAFFKFLKSDDKHLVFFDCDHWFFDAVFYNQLSDNYGEEDRKTIVKSIMAWISERS